MVANERGQLLLVGGIAVAIVVFSTILFAHSLAVTDGITTTGSAETIERSADREASVERDLGRLAGETRADDLDGFEERYKYALRNYTKTHNRVVASSGGTYLNATLNESASNGTEVSPPTTDKFLKPSGGGGSSWRLATNVTPVAAFNVTVDDVDGASNPTTIVVENATDSWTMTLDGTPPGTQKEIFVNTVSRCSGNGTARIDLLDGTCQVGADSGMYPPFTEQFEGPYNITIKHGSHSDVRYRFVAVGNFSSIDPGHRDPYIVVPAVDLTYDTPSASYNRTVLVEADDR
ncbi:hypothetical protein [Haloarcula sp. H-GB5]